MIKQLHPECCKVIDKSSAGDRVINMWQPTILFVEAAILRQRCNALPYFLLILLHAPETRVSGCTDKKRTFSDVQYGCI